MLDFLKSNWSDILAHIAQHVWLVFISIAIAVVIALPVGVLITRKKSLRSPILGIANVMQTIPSLALFGFLIPLPFIGAHGNRGIGFLRAASHHPQHGHRDSRRRRSSARSCGGHGHD